MYPKRVGGFLYRKYICCTYYMATELVFTDWVLCLCLFILVFIYYFLSFLLNPFITYRLHFSLLNSDIRAWNRLRYVILFHVGQYSGGWPDTSIFCEWLYLREFVLLFHLTAPRFLSLYGVHDIWTNHMCEYEKLVDLHRRGKSEVLRGCTDSSLFQMSVSNIVSNPEEPMPDQWKPWCVRPIKGTTLHLPRRE